MFKDWSVYIKKDDDKEEDIIEYNNNKSLSYLCNGFISSYSMLTRAFAETNFKIKDFKPVSVLDFGSGPGTGALVADDFYGDTLKDYTLVDTSVYMNKIAEQMLSSIKGRLNYWNNIVELTKKNDKYDLIVASQIFSELPSCLTKQAALDILYSIIKYIIDQLNENGLMIIVEPGTYYGSHTVISAREYLRNYASIVTKTTPFIIAPCLHQEVCPFYNSNNKRYCYYLQQSPPPPNLTKSHQRSTASRLSYVSLTKLPGGLKSLSTIIRKDCHRILGHPLKRHNHVIIDSCNADGTFGRTIYTKGNVEDKEKYKALNIFLNNLLKHLINHENQIGVE